MKKLFLELREQASCSRNVSIIDTVITFSSSQGELIDLFIDPLQYLLPTDREETYRSFTCVVAPTTVVDNWPDSLAHQATQIRAIDNMSVADATLFSSECGMTLVIKDVGSIYHSGEGEFLCLVKPPARSLQKGEFQNVLALATVLTSETLLLTNKLLVHAGAVGTDGKCQLWTGDSGSGKTTRILTMVNRGWDFYGEDQIIVGMDREGNWRVWPFWRKIKVSAETSKLFPTTQDLSIRPPNERKKYSFDNIEEVLLVRKPASATITSIIKLLPGNKKILKELDLAEAFQHLSPGFLHSLLPDSSSRAMDIVLDLIAEVPASLVSWDMLEEFDRRQSLP
jgi:hypothetical protein